LCTLRFMIALSALHGVRGCRTKELFEVERLGGRASPIKRLDLSMALRSLYQARLDGWWSLAG
jgi:hypothetical protein